MSTTIRDSLDRLIKKLKEQTARERGLAPKFSEKDEVIIKRTYQTEDEKNVNVMEGGQYNTIGDRGHVTIVYFATDGYHTYEVQLENGDQHVYNEFSLARWPAFKVGDRVTLTGAPDSRNQKDYQTYNPLMTACIRVSGEVRHISANNAVHVTFDNGYSWKLNPALLDSESKLIDETKHFNVGDRVVIIKDPTPEEARGAGFVPQMKGQVGKGGVVTREVTDVGFGQRIAILFDEKYEEFWWPVCAAQLESEYHSEKLTEAAATILEAETTEDDEQVEDTVYVEPVAKFKENDMVIIDRIGTPDELGRISWVGTMDNTVGMVGVVQDVHKFGQYGPAFSYRVYFQSLRDYWTYPEACLKKASKWRLKKLQSSK